MPRATDRFLKEIRRSHEVYSYVEVKAPNQEVIRLPATDGTVSVDRTAAVRRTCDITCVDPLGELAPKGQDSPLTPYGTEIRPYRGVRYAKTNEFPEGETEVYPLGVFRISKVTVTDKIGGSPEIKIEGFDLSRTVARDRFVQPYVIPEQTNVITAIKEIAERTFPGVEYDAISTTLTTTAPRVHDVGDDPWEAITTLATAIACEAYFDASGILVIAPPVDIDALPSPDFTYIEGQQCIMTDLSRIFSDEPGFNGVVVTGESPGDELPAVRAEAWDEEPTSATYRFGPYGEVPMFHTDQLVKTEAEAAAVAQALLQQSLGVSSQLSITAVVNPSYEASDIIEVVRARSGVAGLHILDAFDIPLSMSSTQGLRLRQKRLALEE
jgi:hypothetical protein